MDKMDIIIAKNSGFCFGVRRAIDIAYRARAEHTGRVTTLGDLIHNPRVVHELEERGIHSEDDPDNIREGTVIIRSHGVSPAVDQALRSRNLQVIDATCPSVRKIHRLAANLAEQGVRIIIVGNPRHPEVIGIEGHSRNQAIICDNPEAAEKLPFEKKRALLAQSTQSPDLLHQIAAVLISKTEELTVYNTICDSTRSRQEEICRLASDVDALLIIGGKLSSNTRQLYQLARMIQPRTYFIETAMDITPEMIKGTHKIGLGGGASTPPETIQEAVDEINSSFEHQFQRENKGQCQS